MGENLLPDCLVLPAQTERRPFEQKKAGAPRKARLVRFCGANKPKVGITETKPKTMRRICFAFCIAPVLIVHLLMRRGRVHTAVRKSLAKIWLFCLPFCETLADAI
jgi:hypothetical protein